jgi:YD repeat-containing protein
VLVFDPVSGTSKSLTTLGAARAWHTATVLPDGTVLIAGGSDRQGRLVEGGERLDPTTGALTAMADGAPAARARHTATLLTDGRVLLSGGTHGGNARAEVWDPATGTSAVVPGPPSYERQHGRSRLRADGRVEVSGGTDASGNPVQAVEVFDPELSAFVFDPEPAADGGQPHVMAVSPPDGSSGVLRNVRLSMRFSEPIDARSAATLSLTDLAGATVPTRVVAAEGGMLAFVTPLEPLAAGQEFRLAASSVATLTGGRVAAFESRFVTAADTPDPTSATPRRRTGSKEAFDSPWRKLPPLEAASGVTALAGQVLLLDGEPLRHVTLAIEGRRVRTDRTGRFLLELGNAESGWKELVIDGTSANRAGATYGVFEVAAQIVGGQSASLPYTIWMPEIDTANRVRLASPTTGEVVVTTPHIPGLELHLPRNTVITDRQGKVVREVSITPIPVEQPPFPLPAGVSVPVYFTIQPGGAYLTTHSYGPGRKGPWLVYPNYAGAPPGTQGRFWHYDPEEKGWHLYGMGQVSADGRQAVPDPGVALYAFTGAMFDQTQTPGPDQTNGPADGDPADLGNGQFVMDKTDLALQDMIPLALTRTYRPADNASRAFGIGTTHPYAIFLWSANPYQEADLILPNGKRIHYVRISAGAGYDDAVFEHTASPTAFYQSRLAWNGNGWDLTTRDGTVYVFGAEAPLQSIRDRFGNTIRLSWSLTNQFGWGYGNITRITSPTGRFIALTYDGFNRITQATDHIGRTVGYEYDGSGRLWKVTDARGGVTEYTYDIAHRMLTIEDPRNIVYLENEYDTSGRVITQTQADGGEFAFAYTVNGSGVVTQTDVTDPRGQVRRVTFNADRFMTSDTRAQGTGIAQTTTYTRVSGSNLVETETDALGRVTRYAYDSMGNVTSVTSLDGTADAVTTSYTYDATYNLPLTVTDPLTHTTTLAYDGEGRIQSTTDALSHQTTFGTNQAGQVVTVTTPLNKTTTMSYAFGDLVSVATPLGHTESRFVNAAGRLGRVVDAKGAVTLFDYDAHDQLTKITDPRGGETTFTYDGNGNLLTLTDARSKTTTWTYDDMDRVETRTDPLSRTETFVYDLNGNLTSWTDRKGQVTTYQYDALDRQTFVGFGTTGNPATYASTITTTYDAGDRATDIVDSVAGTIERTYDLLDRLTEESRPKGRSPTPMTMRVAARR